MEDIQPVLGDGHHMHEEPVGDTMGLDSVRPIAVAICTLAAVELMLVVSHIVACYATGKCFSV